MSLVKYPLHHAALTMSSPLGSIMLFCISLQHLSFSFAILHTSHTLLSHFQAYSELPSISLLIPSSCHTPVLPPVDPISLVSRPKSCTCNLSFSLPSPAWTLPESSQQCPLLPCQPDTIWISRSKKGTKAPDTLHKRWHNCCNQGNLVNLPVLAWCHITLPLTYGSACSWGYQWESSVGLADCKLPRAGFVGEILSSVKSGSVKELHWLRIPTGEFACCQADGDGVISSLLTNSSPR